MSEEKFVYTSCMGTGCHEHCFLKTIVKDGKIVRTERAVLGEPEGDRYGICQKGIEYAKFPCLPVRILHPLKRVGERGEGKFEEITWDQAMDEIGAKLRDIRDKYGPESVVVNMFSCGYPANWSNLHTPLGLRFIHTFGATNQGMETIDEGYFFATQFDLGSSWAYLTSDNRLLREAKHILIWCSNPLGATRASATTRHFLDAQERGAKLVNIGLTYDSTAAKADQFVPVKGGTDGALAMAMDHVLIEEDLVDWDYVTKYTVAPFLVRQDNGKFLRESDIKPDGDPAKYVIWNKLPAGACAIAAKTFDFGAAIPDLLAAHIINGIACKTAFLLLKESLAERTPEWQEALTGVPPATVRQLVHEYVANKPAVIWLNMGMRYYNAGRSHRAIHLLAALSGNMGLHGGKLLLGAYGDGWPTSMNDLGVLMPDGPENVKGAFEPTTDFLESFKAPEPKYHAWLNVNANPIHAWPNRKMWVEQILPKLDLIVDYEVRMCDTVLFSDYVLPDTTTFERYELLLPQGSWAVLQEPAIEPMGDVKPTADFWRLLAKQVGLEQYFDKTTEEWLALRLESMDPGIAGINPPLSLERLKKEKMVRLNVPAQPFDPFAVLGFLTPSGRFEFYSEALAGAGEAMTKWVPPLIHGPKRKDYPLQLYVARHRVFFQTQFTEFSDLRAVAGKEPWMWINPADARARGIHAGEKAEVFNDRGKMKIQVRLSEAVPPGVVELWYGYRAAEYDGDPPTALQVPVGTSETYDDLCRVWLEELKKRYALPPGEKPSWAGFQAGRLPDTMNLEVEIAGNWDVLWDNFCEVRKA